MKTTITIVCISLAFYVKSFECTFQLSEIEKALNDIEVKGAEDLFRNVNKRKISRYNRKQPKAYQQDIFIATSNQRGGRFKRKGCDPPEFVLPAIPRLRYISAKNVPSPLVVTASTYIWKPLKKGSRKKRSFCEPHYKFIETSHLEIRREASNNSSSKNNSSNNRSLNNGTLTHKKIGIGKKKLFQKPHLDLEVGTNKKKNSKECDDGGPYTVTHNITFQATEKSQGKDEPSNNNKNNNSPLGTSPRSLPNRTFGRKLFDKLSAIQNKTLDSNKLNGMHKLPEKLKTAEKNIQVDMGHEDNDDDGLQVLNDLMRQFLANFKSKTPSLSKQLNRAFKEFIASRLLGNDQI